MPEAPEVQTVVSTLENQIKGCTITEIEVFYPRLIESDLDAFCKNIVGQRLQSFSRWGKYLILGLDQYDWIVHLRMEGRFYLYKILPEDRKHIHAIFTLSDGRKLCYHDTRKFGRMGLYKKDQWQNYPPLENLGLDYSSKEVTGQYLHKKIHPLKRNLKSALLDQSIIAGIGNIYADEICFACGLDPRSRCSKISKRDAEKIVSATKEILYAATQSGGTTIRTYTSSLGITGLFQMNLRVHDQKGKACPLCQKLIKKIVVAQRGTYICLNCQKRK